MRGLIRGVLVLSLGPLLASLAVSVVTLPASSASSSPAALDAMSRDALPSKDAILSDALGSDALVSDAPDAKSDAPKKPDAFALPDVKPIAPDPTPLAAEAVFVLSLKWTKGTLTLEKVRREKLPKGASLPRHLGRFAVELFSGPTLVERLRFDFPLMEDDTAAGDTYAKGLTASVEVKIPDSDRPNKLEIWDRATDRRWSFPYPPEK